MSKARNPKVGEAHVLYRQGLLLKDIAKELDVPEGTVRRWKSTYKWDCSESEQKSERSEKKKANVRKDVAQVTKSKGLTDKQRLFCLHYVKYFNATKAYQKAYGVSYETAAAISYRLLENEGIREEIMKLKQNRLNREMLTESDIFQKYMDIAFSDITDFLEFGREEQSVMGPFGPVTVKDPYTGENVELKKMVNVVKFKDSTQVDGTLITEVKQGKDGASIKMADRMAALKWIADHMDLATNEQKARIAALNAKTAVDGAATDEPVTFQIMPASQAPKEGDQDD